MTKLTRENRYEELTGITMPHRDGGSLVPHVNVLRCRSCGSLLLSGDEDLHERLHPPISCGMAHPHWGVQHIDPETRQAKGHAWEEQFGTA